MKTSNLKKIAKGVLELEILALKRLKKSINKTFEEAVNAIVNCNQNLSLFASNFRKIAFDVNIMYGNEEIVIPKISIGSSFKPSKVNCTVCDSVQMNTIKVMGNTHEVVSANSKGNLQLNVFIPLVTFNTLESIELLKYSVQLFIKGLLSDIKMNDKT